MKNQILLMILLSIVIIYLIKNRYKDQNNSNIKIYASFTSIPGRLDKIESTLKSILRQNYPIEKIFINIPEGTHTRTNKSYYIPKFLYKYPDNIVVNRCKEYGPATKLLGSIPYITDPNAYIYVVDDDISYPKNHLRKLIKHIKNIDDVDAVINPLCWAAYVTKDGVCGYSGYIIKRKVLDKIYDFYDKLPKSCLTVDDQWIGIYLHNRTKNIKRAPLIDSLWSFLTSYYNNRIKKDKLSLNNSSNKIRKKSNKSIFDHSENDQICRDDLLKK